MKKLYFLIVGLIITSIGFSQGDWQTSSAISTVSSYRGATAAIVDGDQYKLYVLGGWTTSSGNFNETSIFDFTNDSWSAGPVIPENTKGGSAVYVDDNIYLLTGNDGDDVNINSQLFLKYSLSSNAWEYMAQYPVAARYVASAYCEANQTIYGAGGSGDYYAAVDQVNAYDLETDSWKACTPLPFPNSGGSALVCVGNHLYLMGGLMNEPYNKIFKGLINPDFPTDIQWLPCTSMPVEMTKVSAGYIGNGLIMATDLTGTFIYNISTDQWNSADDKPILVKGGNFTSFPMDDQYVFAVSGGKDEPGNLIDHLDYFTSDVVLLYPTTFVVNSYDGNPVVNAEIQIGEASFYTDEAGSSAQFLPNGSYDYTAIFDGIVIDGSFIVDGEAVLVQILLPVSIQEISMELKVYPNPSTGNKYINLEIPQATNAALNISLVDILGKHIYDSKLDNSGTHLIDVSNYNKGVYFIVISNPEAYQLTKKLLIN